MILMRNTGFIIIVLTVTLFSVSINFSGSLNTTNNTYISNTLQNLSINNYNVLIKENGLPINATWYIYVNNKKIYLNLTKQNIVVNRTITYNINIPNLDYNSMRYIPNINNYTFNYSVYSNFTINYTNYFKTVFYDSGLPINATWYISYNNNTQSSTGNEIIFNTTYGNYIYNVPNVWYNNISYTTVINYSNITSGKSVIIKFNPMDLINYNVTTKNSSFSYKNMSNISKKYDTAPQAGLKILNISSTKNNTLTPNSDKFNILNALKKYNLYKGTWIKSPVLTPNSSIIKKYGIFSKAIKIELNTSNQTNSYINQTIPLNNSVINNLSSLNLTKLYEFTRYVNGIGNVTQSFRNISTSYGKISNAGKYVAANKNLYFIDYNNNSSITYYNISVNKAAPNMSIQVNGASFNKPNATANVYLPFTNNQQKNRINISLESILGYGNYATYYYFINFSNGTKFNGSLNYTYFNKTFSYELWRNESASITFYTTGNANFTSVDPTLIVIPTNIVDWIPITITNFQTFPTSYPFQQILNINSQNYSIYENNSLQNIMFFYTNGTIIHSWLEYGNSNTATNTIYWLSLNGIAASSSETVYMGFASRNTNLFNTITTGEAPQLSSTYGKYDDGTNVFTYYNVNPSSTSSWTIHGFAGQKSSAPLDNHYQTTNALYANSSSGDYMYRSISGLSENSVISFDVYTTGLGNLFFLANSTGTGQMARLDSRGGGDYSGLATTNSWTSWTAPVGLDELQKTWYKYDIIISNNKADAYIGSVSDNIITLGSTTGSPFSISNKGGYIGLIGDGLGSSYVTYWNGIIIRAYPPNGVMPSVAFGSVDSLNAPELSFQNNPVFYGSSDLINGSGSNSTNNVELLKNGNLIAGPATNTISYTICGATPYINSCLSPGSYTFSIKDITTNQNANSVLSIQKSTPIMGIHMPKVIVYNGSAIPINYYISTVGNQLESNLLINGSTVSNSYLNTTYNFYPNANALYNVSVSTFGNGNYLQANVIQNVCILSKPQIIPNNISTYAPLCIVNNQSVATGAPFQELININESVYKNYIYYNSNKSNFKIFNSFGIIQPAWIEQNHSGNLTIWIKLSNSIPARSVYPIYIGFTNSTINTLSASGVNGIGEYPTATSTYAQYDNGNNVFNNYFNGGSLSNWNVAGAAGQTGAAPSGSPFGLNALYANGGNGDYLDTIASNQVGNSIIEYYTYTENLDDLFFLANATGAGQIGRVGNGGGWYGIASSSSWTSWTAPPDAGTWSNEWLLIGITITNGNAQMSLSTLHGIYGSELDKNMSNIYTVTNDGNYLGFVGDAAGSTTTQYLNGVIIRTYPPNGVMPYVLEGGEILSSPLNTCTISLNSGTINFNVVNPFSTIATVNSIIDTNNGNTNAHIFVSGTNWLDGTNNFGVSNTTWSNLNNTPYSSANKLSTTAENTLLIVNPQSSNVIYFGLNVPKGINPGTYTQTVTIENSC